MLLLASMLLLAFYLNADRIRIQEANKSRSRAVYFTGTVSILKESKGDDNILGLVTAIWLSCWLCGFSLQCNCGDRDVAFVKVFRYQDPVPRSGTKIRYKGPVS
jgi:hypothetical protein